jgi:hypothetical protein
VDEKWGIAFRLRKQEINSGTDPTDSRRKTTSKLESEV